MAEAIAAKKHYEVCVIGAGVVGLSCAWRAAQRGLSVICLDRAEPGAGASKVAAGMLAPVTEADFGEEALLSLNLEGAQMWPAFDRDLAASSLSETGYLESGALVVAADRDDALELKRLHEFQRSLGLEAQWLTPRACRELEPGLSPHIAGGVLAPHDHQVDPRVTVRALTNALEAEGGELLADTEVAAVEVTDGRAVGVTTRSGHSVAADAVVLCAGTATELVRVPGSDVASVVRPVKGQILRFLQAMHSALCTRIVRTPRCYVVSRRSGEVVIGATMEERGFDTSVTGDGIFRLLEAAHEVLPDVAELRFHEASAGLRPATPDNGPMIGPDPAVDGLIWAVGHHRNGVLLAPLTGEAVADIVCGRNPRPVVSSFLPQRFAAQPAHGGRR